MCKSIQRYIVLVLMLKVYMVYIDITRSRIILFTFEKANVNIFGGIPQPFPSNLPQVVIHSQWNVTPLIGQFGGRVGFVVFLLSPPLPLVLPSLYFSLIALSFLFPLGGYNL